MKKTLLQWILISYCSVLVTSEGQTKGLRVVHKMVGGHITLNRDEDVELITSGAGEGKSTGKKKSEQEEKKTLAQQVADGKYGLIQRELFSKPLKKPGVISYKENSEVPRDTIRNLGGLNKSDIWLSENHLLVIKGGSYPPHTSQSLETDIWPSIDDYNAPGRQVKIPAHPKVPPPFPVQLTDNGPLLLLGTNASKTLNGTFESAIHSIYPEENFVPGGEPPDYPYRNPTNPSPGETPFPISPFPPPGLDFYDPTKEGPINGSFPLFPFIGPGDLPPVDNVTYDEDDPSIYYPPPYSFFYPKDNSSEVPPGPLVPGIILPPPPNFFAPLEDDVSPSNTTRTKTPTTSTIPTTTHKPITHRLNLYDSPKHTTTLKPTVGFKTKTTTQFNKVPIQNNIIVTATPVTTKPPTISNTKKKYPTITILKAITTALPQINKHAGQPFEIYGPPPTSSRSKTIVTTTRVPLKTYYTTTNIEPISNTKPKKQFIDEVVVNIPKGTTSKPAAQYYFYDENIINTTPRQKQQEKFSSPQYYVPAKQIDIFVKETPPREQNLRYYYIDDNQRQEYAPKPQRPDTFSIHIARLRDQIHTYQSALQNNDYYQRPVYQSEPRPVYQYSFQANGYQNQGHQYPQADYSAEKSPVRHYNVEIQEAVEVTPPTPIYETTQDNYYYSGPVTENPRNHNKRKNRPRPKPISQYSFEATPNPIFQQLYTKHDEPYIDDVTKEYFTSFGQKLPVATTPIPSYARADYLNSKSHNQGSPISLERDTLVNYLPQKPKINSHAEYIDDLRYNVDRSQGRSYNSNLQNIPGKVKEEARPFVSYKLPGDEGTHFYFLTPQLAQKREQNGSFYFSKSNKEPHNSDYV